jgi:hypothetical protein
MKKIVLGIFIVFVGSVYSQFDAQLSQYMFHSSAFNPAAVGESGLVPVLLGGALDVGRDVFVLHGHGGIHSQKIDGITANYTGSSQGIGRPQRIARRQKGCDRGGLSRCLHAARQRYFSLLLPGHAAFFCGYMLPRVFCQ